MKKFSKIEESNSNDIDFIVQAKISLRIKASNEGEAGYLSDSILGSVKELENFEILIIKNGSNDGAIYENENEI